MRADCLRCGQYLDQDAVWCRSCTAKGHKSMEQSHHRQMVAGNPRRNWRRGDPFWWLASGCYPNYLTN